MQTVRVQTAAFVVAVVCCHIKLKDKSLMENRISVYYSCLLEQKQYSNEWPSFMNLIRSYWLGNVFRGVGDFEPQYI